MAMIERCTQDHRKIQAGAQPGIGVWCGVCGINLSKNITKGILAAKEATK